MMEAFILTNDSSFLLKIQENPIITYLCESIVSRKILNFQEIPHMTQCISSSDPIFIVLQHPNLAFVPFEYLSSASHTTHPAQNLLWSLLLSPYFFGDVTHQCRLQNGSSPCSSSNTACITRPGDWLSCISFQLLDNLFSLKNQGFFQVVLLHFTIFQLSLMLVSTNISHSSSFLKFHYSFT